MWAWWQAPAARRRRALSCATRAWTRRRLRASGAPPAPAPGLDRGPCTQEERAVATLAELVAWRHTTGVSPAEEVGEAIDPICGMTVAIAGARETLELDGTTYYFCGPGEKA